MGGDVSGHGRGLGVLCGGTRRSLDMCMSSSRGDASNKNIINSSWGAVLAST